MMLIRGDDGYDTARTRTYFFTHARAHTRIHLFSRRAKSSFHRDGWELLYTPCVFLLLAAACGGDGGDVEMVVA